MKKLQNKKTGEIKDICEVLDMKQEDGVLYKYCSLDELNEEWEDYKEPKEFWYIDEWECRIDSSPYKLNEDMAAFLEELGLKFNTEEEAKKAVEKMKAWTRLKNGGLKFERYYLGLGGNYSIKFETGLKCDTEDLDLLFGGEE